ncbi:MAG: FecR domain-containing protein [Saprospiraceae bacterium]|nr:FecR domain-containing protein [Saprospiraceae bacterium]
MHSRDYTGIADFLEDPSFVAWVHQTDAEAVRYWNGWQVSHPEQRERIEAAIAAVKGIRFVPHYVSEEKVAIELERLNVRIEEASRVQAQSVPDQSPWTSRSLVLRMVAGLGLLLMVGIVWNQWQGGAVMIVQNTDYGERIEMNLPDGTHVSVNAHSTIKYQKNNPRKVWLEGEAFFRVAKKTGTGEKFQVITPDLTVQVYGTEFNVNSRKQQTQVVLEEGKVRLALQNGTEKEMNPGDLITYSAARNQVVEEMRIVRAETITSWKDGTLVFDDIRLQDAMGKIAELYGLEIEFEDAEIAEKIIHLAVPTQNLDICLTAMERSGGMQILREDRRLIVKKLLR